MELSKTFSADIGQFNSFDGNEIETEIMFPTIMKMKGRAIPFPKNKSFQRAPLLLGYRALICRQKISKNVP